VPLRTARSAATLARWLGPWAGAASPRGVAREAVPVATASGPTRAYVYAPERPTGVYLVLPGLHFLGPDDPRLDRFCRVLARAGFLVVAPFIRAFSDLVLATSAFDDARAALDFAFTRAAVLSLDRPAVFSISFGSSLALDLATIDRGPRAVIVFGGFCEFLPTVRFAVTGAAEHDGRAHTLVRDPLNSPAVFLNALHALDVPGEKAALARAWRQMVYRTWGRMELKAPGARDPHAHAIAETLPPELRLAFLRGCMLDAGAVPWLEDALSRGAQELAFFDPGERLARVTSPIALVHGRDDDVIPYFETLKLARAIPPRSLAGVHLTGMFGHTGASTPSARAIVDEATTLVSMLAAMARAPRGGIGRRGS
jgi:pimeloyl-ACP methyl ester carboxylesterase